MYAYQYQEDAYFFAREFHLKPQVIKINKRLQKTKFNIHKNTPLKTENPHFLRYVISLHLRQEISFPQYVFLNPIALNLTPPPVQVELFRSCGTFNQFVELSCVFSCTTMSRGWQSGTDYNKDSRPFLFVPVGISKQEKSYLIRLIHYAPQEYFYDFFS